MQFGIKEYINVITNIRYTLCLDDRFQLFSSSKGAHLCSDVVP